MKPGRRPDAKSANKPIRHGLTAISSLFLATFGCSRPEVPSRLPSTTALVFDQEHGLQSAPPSLESDVELPSGVSEFELGLRCRAEGKPCWRAVVTVSLVVDRAIAPSIKLAWREHPESAASDSCTEMDASENSARTCALRVSSEWFARAEDARRLGSEKSPPIDANGRAPSPPTSRQRR